MNDSKSMNCTLIKYFLRVFQNIFIYGNRGKVSTLLAPSLSDLLKRSKWVDHSRIYLDVTMETTDRLLDLWRKGPSLSKVGNQDVEVVLLGTLISRNYFYVRIVVYSSCRIGSSQGNN